MSERMYKAPIHGWLWVIALVCLGGLLQAAAYPQMPTVYVNQSHPSATDTNNPSGSMERPRRTIPNPVPSGAIVEIQGAYGSAHTSPNTLRINGTATQPVLIRGVDASSPAVLTAGWEVTGTFYELAWLKGQGAGIVLVAPNADAVLRDSEFAGVKGYCAGIAVSSYVETAWNRRIRLTRNHVHDQGDPLATHDQDCHGIGVGARAEYITIEENELARNSGDGLQINSGSSRSTRHVYVVRNWAHHNRQAGLWTKQATDVVFYRNRAHDHRPTAASGTAGACLGGQYGPEHFWLIENSVWNCDYGLHLASGIGDGRDGQYVFVLSNVIRDIRDSNASFRAGNVWSEAGISLIGGSIRYVFSNRLQNVDNGIAVGAGTTYEGGDVLSGPLHAAGGRPVIGTLTPAEPSGALASLRNYFTQRYGAW